MQSTKQIQKDTFKDEGYDNLNDDAGDGKDNDQEGGVDNDALAFIRAKRKVDDLHKAKR